MQIVNATLLFRKTLMEL